MDHLFLGCNKCVYCDGLETMCLTFQVLECPEGKLPEGSIKLLKQVHRFLLANTLLMSHISNEDKWVGFQ